MAVNRPPLDAKDFAAVAAALLAEPAEAPTARLIVDTLRDLVAEADHVSLTVRAARRRFTTLAATSELARRADELQYELSEGPCLDAARREAWVRSGEVGRDPRWRTWGPRAGALDLRSLLSVQLVSGGRAQGALNVYSHRAGSFADPDDVDLAVVYAVHAASALTSARLVTHLGTALTSRHTIGVAQGVVMERYGLTQDQSFAFLRRLAETHETKVRDVAQAIVDTGRVPDADVDPDGPGAPES